MKLFILILISFFTFNTTVNANPTANQKVEVIDLRQLEANENQTFSERAGAVFSKMKGWFKGKGEVVSKWSEEKIDITKKIGKDLYDDFHGNTEGLVGVEDEYLSYEENEDYEQKYYREEYNIASEKEQKPMPTMTEDQVSLDEESPILSEEVDSAQEQIELSDDESSYPNYASQDFHHIVERAYQEDESCQSVVTGNMCRGTGCIARPTLNYAKVIAKTYLDKVCATNSETLNLIKKAPISTNDALSFSQFALEVTDEESLSNAQATFALVYTLGYRESHGDFLEGRDMSASNTHGLTEEAGYMQFSANMMIGDGEAKDLLRKTMRSFVNKLDKMSTPQKASYCAADYAGEKTSKNRDYDPSGNTLAEEFNNTCSALVKNEKFSENPFPLTYSSDDFTEEFSSCFNTLQKYCPTLPTQLGAVMVRSHRKHNGPLWTKDEWQRIADAQRSKGNTKKADFYDTFASSNRPYLVPSCKEVFTQIDENKDSLCASNVSP